MANDKYSLDSAPSVDNHQPPTYNEYKDNTTDNEAEIQQKLEQIGRQIDWKIEQQPVKIVTSSLPNNSAAKPRQSLLRRMWNSLNSNEVTTDNAMHNNHVETSYPSVSDKVSPVQEVPDFLRKR